ncbi:MAG TPA: AraC family ligand binding domain-containing protein, partial [Patescibacteria group bacterium]|nr:AraC family ligand binding domain-containing protein [Patescibacteria group bacterium]
MVASSDEVSVLAWKPPVPGVREVLHARFGEHAYPPHTHDTWTLFIVDDGIVRYVLDRTERGAEPAMVSLLPPHVVHDGRVGRTGGYRKRVIYLEPEVFGEALIGG